MLHFELSEFDSPDHKGSGLNMDKAFLQMLDDARGMAGIPFHITSGFRTGSHNEKVGGSLPTNQSKGSSHLYGYAADIACVDSRSREIILNALVKAGFRRIGIAQGFIHADNDPDKPNALWLYN